MVTDDVEKCRQVNRIPKGIDVEDRSNLDAIQRKFREISGVTAIVYDQTCAAEKRRRRRRGEYPDPAKRVFIHTQVCEGCGDCGVQSNCVAILPHETQFGRKRRIDQSACNKDYSCVDGFCPSFVTVNGGSLKKPSEVRSGGSFDPAILPPPKLPVIRNEYCIVINGVGGTGVITVGAVLGMAAHIADLGCSVLDMTGLAQKGGAVMSNLIIANCPQDISSMHVAQGGADLIIGGDLVVSASEKVLSTAKLDRTSAIINSYEMMSGDFARVRDLQFPGKTLQSMIEASVGSSNSTFVNANYYAENLFGNSIAANLFLVGIAVQQGLVPIALEAIEKAIELNGRSVTMNLSAFHRGRQFVVDPGKIDELLPSSEKSQTESNASEPRSLNELIEHRFELLVDYQNTKYAKRYRNMIDAVREADQIKSAGTNELTREIAMNYYKVLAYKDEYEVARLLSDAKFRKELEEQFTGDFCVQYHLAPPIFAKKDRVTGLASKRAFGQWMTGILRVVAKFKFLRGSAFDPFAWSDDRRLELRLIEEYEHVVREVISNVNANNYRIATELVSFPDTIRGFGHIKRQSYDETMERVKELKSLFDSGDHQSKAA